ncbi:MAG: ArsR/SmtB family transcription factor [Candidatus Methanomethylophilaceae archaeon]
MNDNGLPDFEELGDFFKTLGEPSRLRILFTMKDGEKCVRCISEDVGMNISAVSHQLRILKDRNLVTARREGKNMIYSISDHHVHDIITKAMEHVIE